MSRFTAKVLFNDAELSRVNPSRKDSSLPSFLARSARRSSIRSLIGSPSLIASRKFCFSSSEPENVKTTSFPLSEIFVMIFFGFSFFFFRTHTFDLLWHSEPLRGYGLVSSFVLFAGCFDCSSFLVASPYRLSRLRKRSVLCHREYLPFSHSFDSRSSSRRRRNS